MRGGSVFRRCGRCNRRIAGRRCQCGSDSFTWCFVVDLEPPGAPRRQVRRAGFATRAEAQAAMARLQQERSEGRWVEPSRLTVGRWLEDWLRGLELRRDVRPATLAEWAGHVRTHLVPRLGRVRLQQLTLAQVRECYAALLEGGRVRGEGGLSRKTVWNVHLCLHRALEDAVKQGLVSANPAARALRPPRERAEIRFWTSVQVAAFLAWVDEHEGPHDQALYRLAVQTGMRRGELLGLRWQDLDWQAQRLTVGQQLSRHGGFGPPKTRAGRRTIDLSAEVMEALRLHQEAQVEQRRAWEDAYEDHGLVFCRENGRPHDPDQISHRFARQVRRARVEPIRFHDLRHTSAVIGLRELGEWPDEVSKRLGHTSVAFTLDTYGHLLPQRGRLLADRFGRVLADRLAGVLRQVADDLAGLEERAR